MGVNDVLSASLSMQAMLTPESRLCPGGDKKKAKIWRKLLLKELKQWDPISLLFCISPLGDAAFALLEWSHAPQLSRNTSSVFPWKLEAAMFAVQGILSFMSDVVWFGIRPPLRLGVLDRFSAISLVSLQIIKFWLHSLRFCGFVHGMSYEIIGAYSLTPVVVSFFMRGKQAAIDDNRRLFLIYHTCWHFAAPLAFAVYVWASLRVVGMVDSQA